MSKQRELKSIVLVGMILIVCGGLWGQPAAPGGIRKLKGGRISLRLTYPTR